MNENDLSDLVRDAVAGVEPEDRLVELRRRTATPARRLRPWLYAAGGVAAAAAATVAAFAVVDADDGRTGHDRSAHGDTATQPQDDDQLVPAYFVGRAAEGEVLFREFDRSTGSDLLGAALARIQEPPDDPDYSTAWEPGTLLAATVSPGTIDVQVAPRQTDITDLAAQQVVYTVQGAVGERLPVRFLRDGRQVGQLHQARGEAEILNPISISDPAEGNDYSGSMTARGRANSYEGRVPWRLEDGAGTVVREGVAQAEGWKDRMYAWEATVSLEGLEPGTYRFVATQERPPSAGFIPSPDTRTITVR